MITETNKKTKKYLRQHSYNTLSRVRLVYVFSFYLNIFFFKEDSLKMKNETRKRGTKNKIPQKDIKQSLIKSSWLYKKASLTSIII